MTESVGEDGGDSFSENAIFSLITLPRLDWHDHLYRTTARTSERSPTSTASPRLISGVWTRIRSRYVAIYLFTSISATYFWNGANSFAFVKHRNFKTLLICRWCYRILAIISSRILLAIHPVKVLLFSVGRAEIPVDSNLIHAPVLRLRLKPKLVGPCASIFAAVARNLSSLPTQSRYVFWRSWLLAFRVKSSFTVSTLVRSNCITTEKVYLW